MISSFIHMNNLYTGPPACVLEATFFHSPPRPCSPTPETDTGWPLNSQLCRQKSKSTQLSEGYNTLLQQAENNHIPTGSSIPQDGRPLSPPATSCRRKHAERITFKYLTQVWLRCPYRDVTVNTSNFVLNPALSVPTPRRSTVLLRRV